MGLVTRPVGGGGHYSRKGLIFLWLLEIKALFERGLLSREYGSCVVRGDSFHWTSAIDFVSLPLAPATTQILSRCAPSNVIEVYSE